MYTWGIVTTFLNDAMKAFYWSVLVAFHWDVDGCFIRDVPAILLGRTEKCCHNNFKTLSCQLGSMFTPNIILNYEVKCDIYYLLIVNVEYSVHLQPLHKDLPFLSEKIVISGHKKLVCTITIKKIIH